MTEYFGAQFNPNFEDPDWAGFSLLISPKFRCPGVSGTRTVYSLEMYTYAPVSSGNIKVGLYDSSKNKVCEGAAEVSVSTTKAWYGHVGQANITPNPCSLTVGDEYYLLVSIDSNNVKPIARNLGGVNNYYYAGDYTNAAMPDSLGAGTAWPNQMQLRCGLTGDPAALPGLVYFGLLSHTEYTYSGGENSRFRIVTPFTCPGSGDRTVYEISQYCSDNGLYKSWACLRLGIYDSSYNLVGQGRYEVHIGETDAWYGHVGQDAINPYPLTLTGGETYYLANSYGFYETPAFYMAEQSFADGTYWVSESTPYSWAAGMPASFSGAGNANGRPCIRVGIEGTPSYFWPVIARLLDQQRS